MHLISLYYVVSRRLLEWLHVGQPVIFYDDYEVFEGKTKKFNLWIEIRMHAIIYAVCVVVIEHNRKIYVWH